MELIIFRPLEYDDLEHLKSYRNSTETMPYVREYRYLNSADQDEWYKSYLASRRKSDFDQEIVVIFDEAPEMIGVGGFTRIEWKNRKAELTFYSLSQTLQKEAIVALLNKGFKEFGFHKITWPVYSHDPNLNLYNGLFDEKVVLKEEYWYNGWQDRIYLSSINPLDK